MRRATIACALGLALGCGDGPAGTVTIVTGEETDVMTRPPAPVTLVTETIALDGTRAEISRATLPIDTVELGSPPRQEIGALAVTGLDATGAPVVRGRTLFVQWGAIEATPLEVFVQRTGELARMPRPPAAFDAAIATLVAGRYVLAARDTAVLLYDTLALRSPTSAPTLPRPARSIASVGTAALLIDDAGATTFELSDGTSQPLEPPAGGTFAEVAGGARATARDGTQYVVGATRTTAPSARVLVVDASGHASFAALAAPRRGACAAYVEGRGLVVVGGDAGAPGAEVLAPGGAVATPLPFPPDPIEACGATALDTTHVAVAGGGAVRVLDLTCASACAPVAWPGEIPLARAEAATLAPDSAFVLGDDASGTTRAYRASASGAREVPLRTPRRGARLVTAATGGQLVVGGAAGVEQYLE